MGVSIRKYPPSPGGNLCQCHVGEKIDKMNEEKVKENGRKANDKAEILVKRVK
jgi:hypothetical protein